MWAPGGRQLGSAWRVRPRIGRGWRRPLAVRQAGAARGAGRSPGEEARFQASCTPFRHLGFFPDMSPVWSLGAGSNWLVSRSRNSSTCSAIPASARWRFQPTGARLRPCRRLEEVGGAGARQRRAVRHERSPRPLDHRRCRQVRRRARPVAAGAMTVSCSIRPSIGRGPEGEDLAAGRGSARPHRRLPAIAG